MDWKTSTPLKREFFNKYINEHSYKSINTVISMQVDQAQSGNTLVSMQAGHKQHPIMELGSVQPGQIYAVEQLVSNIQVDELQHCFCIQSKLDKQDNNHFNHPTSSHLANAALTSNSKVNVSSPLGQVIGLVSASFESISIVQPQTMSFPVVADVSREVYEMDSDTSDEYYFKPPQQKCNSYQYSNYDKSNGTYSMRSYKLNPEAEEYIPKAMRKVQECKPSTSSINPTDEPTYCDKSLAKDLISKNLMESNLCEDLNADMNPDNKLVNNNYLEEGMLNKVLKEMATENHIDSLSNNCDVNMEKTTNIDYQEVHTASLNELQDMGNNTNSSSDVVPTASLNELKDMGSTTNSSSDIVPTASLNLQDMGNTTNSSSDVLPTASLNELQDMGNTTNSSSDVVPTASLNELQDMGNTTNSLSDVAPESPRSTEQDSNIINELQNLSSESKEENSVENCNLEHANNNEILSSNFVTDGIHKNEDSSDNDDSDEEEGNTDEDDVSNCSENSTSDDDDLSDCSENSDDEEDDASDEEDDANIDDSSICFENGEVDDCICFENGEADDSICFKNGEADDSICFENDEADDSVCFENGEADDSICFENGEADDSICFENGEADDSICFENGESDDSICFEEKGAKEIQQNNIKKLNGNVESDIFFVNGTDNGEQEDKEDSIQFESTDTLENEVDSDDNDYECGLFKIELGNDWGEIFGGLIITNIVPQSSCNREENDEVRTSNLCNAFIYDENDSFDEVDCDCIASLSEEVMEANRKWSININKDCQSSTPQKVTFLDDVEIYSVDDWCRKGPWEECARDRMRFRRRIDEVESVLSPILTEEHRCRILSRLS